MSSLLHRFPFWRSESGLTPPWHMAQGTGPVLFGLSCVDGGKKYIVQCCQM